MLQDGSARNVLISLVEVLNSGSSRETDLKDLWDIITGLRGPDTDNGDMKMATIGVVRYKIGLNDCNGGGCLLGPDTEKYANLRRKVNYILANPDYCERLRQLSDIGLTPHFYCHARAAFKALGLSWSEVNPPDQWR